MAKDVAGVPRLDRRAEAGEAQQCRLAGAVPAVRDGAGMASHIWAKKPGSGPRSSRRRPRHLERPGHELPMTQGSGPLDAGLRQRAFIFATSRRCCPRRRLRGDHRGFAGRGRRGPCNRRVWKRAGSSSARQWRSSSARASSAIRKRGKLPVPTIGVDYALEYGSDRLEIHLDAVSRDRGAARRRSHRHRRYRARRRAAATAAGGSDQRVVRDRPARPGGAEALRAEGDRG